MIHQRVRAAYGRSKKPDVKKRLKTALDYITKRKEASKNALEERRAKIFGVAPVKEEKVEEVVEEVATEEVATEETAAEETAAEETAAEETVAETTENTEEKDA